MQAGFVVAGEQLFEDQRVHGFVAAPQHHQHDDLQVLQRQRPTGHGGGAVEFAGIQNVYFGTSIPWWRRYAAQRASKIIALVRWGSSC